MSSQDELNQAMGSMLDILHLHPDGVDMVIDAVLDVLTSMASTTLYPEEALAMVRKRAEAVREAVKNNPLPAQPESCKQPVH